MSIPGGRTSSRAHAWPSRLGLLLTCARPMFRQPPERPPSPHRLAQGSTQHSRRRPRGLFHVKQSARKEPTFEPTPSGCFGGGGARPKESDSGGRNLFTRLPRAAAHIAPTAESSPVSAMAAPVWSGPQDSAPPLVTLDRSGLPLDSKPQPCLAQRCGVSRGAPHQRTARRHAQTGCGGRKTAGSSKTHQGKQIPGLLPARAQPGSTREAGSVDGPCTRCVAR